MQNITLEEIKTQLLKFLDSENNVVDLQGVQNVLGMLEKYPMSKEDLERTRIGRHVNDMRRKTSNKELAKRAKTLISEWQKIVDKKAESHKQTLQPSTIIEGNKNRTPIHSKISSAIQLNVLNNSKINNHHNDNSYECKNSPSKINLINSEFQKNGKTLNGKLSSSVVDLKHDILNNKRKTSPEINTEMPKNKKIKIESNDIQTSNPLINGKIESNSPDTKILICKVGDDLKCTISTKRISPFEPSKICDPNSSNNLPSILPNNNNSIPKTVALNMQKANSFNGPINSNLNKDVIKQNNSNFLNQQTTSTHNSTNSKTLPNKKDRSISNVNTSTNKSYSHFSRIPSLPDLKLMASPKLMSTNRKVETTAEIYKKFQQNGSLGSLYSMSQVKKNQNKDLDYEVSLENKMKQKKKVTKLEPPLSSAKQIGEAKTDMIKKYLLSTNNINSKHSIPKRENGRNKEDSNVLNIFKTESSIIDDKVNIDISKLDPNSEEYKKEKSTDCDSAGIPLLCVHG